MPVPPQNGISTLQIPIVGKLLKAGIWFGSSKPDDTKGALIYDTYILEEQRCDSNEGMNLLKIEVSVYKKSRSRGYGNFNG